MRQGPTTAVVGQAKEGRQAQAAHQAQAAARQAQKAARQAHQVREAAQKLRQEARQPQAHQTSMLWQNKWPQYWAFRKAAAAGTLLPL